MPPGGRGEFSEWSNELWLFDFSMLYMIFWSCYLWRPLIIDLIVVDFQVSVFRFLLFVMNLIEFLDDDMEGTILPQDFDPTTFGSFTNRWATSSLAPKMGLEADGLTVFYKNGMG